MPSTYVSLHCHIVFSTKVRCAFIGDPWRARLYAYMGGAVRTLEGVPVNIGGTADHVHLLVGLKATHRRCDVVRDVKVASSEWVHQEIAMPVFSWQEGYGAFAVSASQLDVVKEYIAKQEEHHRKRSFQEEFREMLVRSGVQFDERYWW